MIKAVIIDDEKNCVESLQLKLLKHFSNVEIVATANSAASGYDRINAHKPDLVFLDIEMPGGDAFDLLKKFDTLFFEIIFTTAYNTYALKALKLSALDYLLKPIDTNELKIAIEKYLKRQEKKYEKVKKEAGYNQDKELLSSKQIPLLIENYNGLNIKTSKVIIPTVNGYDVVKISDIIYLESDRNYTNFVIKGASAKLSSKNIGFYDEQFVDLNFFRIHQSFLVNLSHIERYIKGSAAQVVMSNGNALPISKAKKNEFKKTFLGIEDD